MIPSMGKIIQVLFDEKEKDVSGRGQWYPAIVTESPTLPPTKPSFEEEEHEKFTVTIFGIKDSYPGEEFEDVDEHNCWELLETDSGS